MPSADYKCRECGEVDEIQSTDPVLDSFCESCKLITRWDRIWTPPHTGRMSSGEPPR